MPDKETVINFSQFPDRESADFDLMPLDEYGVYDLCTIHILEATSHPSGKWFLSRIPCEDMAGDDLCGGEVELIRYDLPGQIKWKCKQCENHGKIVNFEGSEWDISQLSDDEQQQILTTYIGGDDPIAQLEQLPEEELQDFLGFVDQYMDNMGVGGYMRDESGGLDSQQLYQLLDSDWQSPGSLLKLNKELDLDEVDQSLIFHNARAFLLYLKDHGPLPGTHRGNLKRKVVSALIDPLRWPDGYIEEIQDHYSAINEKHIPLLHVTRVLLELADLIYLADSAYHLDERSAELLEDNRAGELYCLLFYTFFKEMNIGYISDFDDYIGIQETIPYTLYELHSQEARWHSIDESMKDILLSFMHDHLDLDGFGKNYVYEFLIKPLSFFGLIETRPAINNLDKAFSVPGEFRKKPLFDQLLSFDIVDKPQNGEGANVIPLNNKADDKKEAYFKKREQKGETKIYQLKITLNDIKPPVWRRVLVSSDTLLPDLHKIIQSSMGWMNGHLHQFEKNGQRYSKPARDWPNNDVDYRKMRIDDMLKREKQKMTYTYDFGDGWRHTILLEETMPIDSDTSYPVCTAGKRNCPPEDCGGPWGYQQMLEAVNDPSHPEHEMYKDWIGTGFDPEHFDKDRINESLQSKNYGVFDLF